MPHGILYPLAKTFAAAVPVFLTFHDLKDHIQWRYKSRNDYDIDPGGLVELYRFHHAEFKAWAWFFVTFTGYMLVITHL